jgi:hypothetical protein
MVALSDLTDRTLGAPMKSADRHRRWRAPSTDYGATTMSKSQQTHREAKKQAQLTAKEKKAAKRAKKHAGDPAPLIAGKD